MDWLKQPRRRRETTDLEIQGSNPCSDFTFFLALDAYGGAGKVDCRSLVTFQNKHANLQHPERRRVARNLVTTASGGLGHQITSPSYYPPPSQTPPHHRSHQHHHHTTVPPPTARHPSTPALSSHSTAKGIAPQCTRRAQTLSRSATPTSTRAPQRRRRRSRRALPACRSAFPHSGSSPPTAARRRRATCCVLLCRVDGVQHCCLNLWLHLLRSDSETRGGYLSRSERSRRVLCNAPQLNSHKTVCRTVSAETQLSKKPEAVLAQPHSAKR